MSRAGEESHALEPLLEMYKTLTTLLNGSAELRDLAVSVDSTVKLLKLSKKVSGKIAMIFETHFISSTEGIMKFFDTVYSTM
jgi:hypothetical protein